ncbi:uncharacterized protein LOC62_01G000258 [Vanrija pseudolonga]|uniref:Alpha 1,4-glycosyltransferase domain-containing protein n=1 Tax=Vanrija pseudolonga TaxID=143232 RepID=A0AAF1BEL2_9TREE|nr:hypothetical protein LOC62_01G000258 [Vanrija pseudolonga]
MSWIALRARRYFGDKSDKAYLPLRAGRDDQHLPLDANDGEGYPPLNSTPKGKWRHAALLGVVLVIGLALGHLTAPTRRVEALHAPLLPRALPPSTDADLSAISASLPARREPVPSIVHYVYGLDESLELPYFAYLAIRSALEVLRPERVLFHCVYEPRGVWWERVRGQLEVVAARNVTVVGVNDAPVVHYAHKADILRLEAIRDYGGTYLDIDTFVLRPFTRLYDYDTVLGMEAAANEADDMAPKGLCNAVIIARPDAPFITRWLASYDTFDESQWADHSVVMPWTLARAYPHLATILSHRAFFWPLWTPDGLREVHEETEDGGYDFDAAGQLAYHAWESVAARYLRKVDPEAVLAGKTGFTRMARRFAAPGDVDAWREDLRRRDLHA